ncbi:MAG: helix-turn-helix domain-containing protein, partial [Thermoanaerobaculia bacterium]|nr:helix-turn-helix domain-containing protein [Thermoanaerobaculia bacterium]
IRIAPLRERREDILPLARFFLARHGEPGLELSPAAEERLVAHAWPGNVRELENAIERAVVLSRDESLGPDDLLLDASAGEPRATAAGAGDGSLQEAIDSATEARVRAALEQSGGRRAEAAQALGVERTTLYRLMKRFDISG